MAAMELFLDLDGVLADFELGVRRVTGKPPEELPVKVLWRELSRHPDFFGTLDFMQDARQLWDFCAPHQPTILTGLPMGFWAPDQKRRWVASMLGAHVPVITCMARDKHRHAGPGKVLVDDREKARLPWEAAGGAFVLHSSAADSIMALQKLGF